MTVDPFSIQAQRRWPFRSFDCSFPPVVLYMFLFLIKSFHQMHARHCLIVFVLLYQSMMPRSMGGGQLDQRRLLRLLLPALP